MAQNVQHDQELDKLAGDYQQMGEKYGAGLKGKQAIVTGSNTGLGYEVAKALLSCGCKVIVATRNPEKGEAAAEELSKLSTTEAPVEFMHLDLASLKSVKSFATDFRKKNVPLHILVNNASAWMTPNAMSPTEDGFEYQSASHFWGHVYLTELLKDKLKASAPSRLVWTVSAAETLGKLDWDDLEMVNKPSDFAQYGTVKLMGQMVTRVYAKQLKSSDVGVFAGQPGMTSTDFFNPEKFSWIKPGAVLQWLMQKMVGLKPEQGAWPVIYCALAPAEDLESAATGRSYGPEYYDASGSLKLGVPNITNKGLIRTQDPENDDIKNYELCEKFYDASIKILNSKPVVKEGVSWTADSSLAADKATDAVKSSVAGLKIS